VHVHEVGTVHVYCLLSHCCCKAKTVNHVTRIVTAECFNELCMKIALNVC
jgi:hypothetical protein